MINKHVNNGRIKCIYSITLPFDLEDCAYILFTVINFAGKGLHVWINAISSILHKKCILGQKKINLCFR